MSEKPMKETPTDKLAKSMSNRQVIVIMAVLVVVMALACYDPIASTLSKQGAIDYFMQVISAGDFTECAEVMTMSDPNTKLNNITIQPFIEYIQEDPDFLESVKQDLEGTGSFIRVKTNGKRFWFFDRYVIEMDPVYLEVISDIKNAKIYIDGREFAVTGEPGQSVLVGPMIAGKYTVDVQLENEFGTLETEQTAYVPAHIPEKTQAVECRLNPGYATVRSNYPSAEVVYKEKSLGQLKNFDRIGPFGDSIQIKLRLTFPWGEFASGPVNLENGSDLEINLTTINEKIGQSVSKDFETLIAKVRRNEELEGAEKVLAQQGALQGIESFELLDNFSGYEQNGNYVYECDVKINAGSEEQLCHAVFIYKDRFCLEGWTKIE